MFGGFISAIQQFTLAGFGVLNDIGMLTYRLFCKITPKVIVVFVIKEKLIEEEHFFKFHKEKMNKLFQIIIPIIDSIYETKSNTIVLRKTFNKSSTQKRIVKSLEVSVQKLFF